MDHFGGLDVSVKETSICIVDDTGRIVKEVKVASEPAHRRAKSDRQPNEGSVGSARHPRLQSELS